MKKIDQEIKNQEKYCEMLRQNIGRYSYEIYRLQKAKDRDLIELETAIDTLIELDTKRVREGK